MDDVLLTCTKIQHKVWDRKEKGTPNWSRAVINTLNNTNSLWAPKNLKPPTQVYKYLGITINTKGDLSGHLKITKGKTQASTHTINNLASSNPLKGIQMETIWTLYRTCCTCTLPMITYGSKAWIMNNQEKQQIQSINNKNLKTILMTLDTTPGIAFRTETAMADITQEIDPK